MTNLFSLGAIVVKAQTQDDTFTRLPLWVWIVIGLIVVAIGVIWTLWEEENKQKRARPATIPEPVGGGAAPPAPAPVQKAEVATRAEAVSIPEPAPVGATPPKPDDLRKVSGIGPKIRQILNENGIYTFEQLAAADTGLLERLMEDRGWNMTNWATWPEQARALAAAKKKG